MAELGKKDSSTTQDTAFISIGVIIGTRGLDGTLKVRPTTDFPERFSQGAEVFLNGNSTTIEKVSWNKENVLLSIKGIASLEEAIQYRGVELTIPSKALRKLPIGCYYQFDIIGIEVYSVDGLSIGCITQILNCSNDVYVVRNHLGKEFLIPATKEIIKIVDIEKRKIIIKPIDGLLD
jgi:16S rRNA processing protein RimM